MAVTSETLKAGGSGLPARPLLQTRQQTSRRLGLDRWAGRLVVLGGVTIIASILAILAVILVEVYPMFETPHAALVGLRRPAGPAEPAPTSPVAADEYREIAYLVTAEGALTFIALNDRAPMPPVPVPGLGGARVTAVTSWVSKEGVWYVIGTADGRIVPVEIKFEVTYEGGRRAVVPVPAIGESSFLDPEQRRPVQRLTFAHTGAGPLAAGQLGPRELVIQTIVEKKALIGESKREARLEPLALAIDGVVTAVRVDERGDDLFVGTSTGRILRYDLREQGSVRLAEVREATSRSGAAVTEIGLLNGDRTVVIGDAAGGVSSWQVVGLPGEGERRLTRIHQFEGHQGPVVAFSPSRRDKGFVTADPTGGIRVHYATSGRTLISLQAEHPGLRAVAIAPKADGLVSLHDDGAVSHWTLANPHPEITLQTLFGAVWYEGYAGPDYVWQSHGGTDDFEAKYSLTPLAFGTVKGTLYALLFAVPIALLAALYVSEFMHPTMKSYVKPVVEVMAALPSVVLGFIAGLWLAPVVERVVPALFVLPVVVAVAILIAAALWRGLPATLRGRVRPGTEMFVVIPVVVVAGATALWLGGVIEDRFLGADYRRWLLSALGFTYDQRNSLVVGIAMGFAVIPIIFTIAEDSLANVPQHLRAGSLALGATRWQTALRVVLPTASPGIFSAVMIGFGRAVGETMIVLMATGNTPVMEWSIFNGFRALSANIAVELPEAPVGHTHYRVLFLAALLLFCLTFLVNTVAELVRLQLRRRYRYL
ncbi:MAG TPA: ABC transporter permease subunit [Methylomirabilota bacterium]|nr:ABC transporter permease subunit [Methylomirabilota bacterium]